MRGLLRSVAAATVAVLAACATPGGLERAPSVTVVADGLRPGQAVEVEVAGFPPGEEVLVGGGLAQSEFQVSERLRTDGAGASTVTLTVPSSAGPGEAWVFVAMTGDRDLRARTEALPVAGGGADEGIAGTGVVTVEGVVSDEGVECLAIRGDDGRLYTLVGRHAGLEPGQRVRVSGEVAEMSFCMQGTTLAVRSITRL